MSIRIATSDAEILSCYPVMRELRPDIGENEFLSRVRSQEKSGYKLAFVCGSGCVVAVAGFRVLENLASGRFLYVDDLVTLSTQRSKGFGAELLTWLKDQAAAENCPQLHLDSGVQREEAHRFYEREEMSLVSFHFAYNLASNKTPR